MEPDPRVGEATSRLGRARLALVQAEERTGLRSARERSLDRGELVEDPVRAAESVRVGAPEAEASGKGTAGRILEIPSGGGPLLRAAAGIVRQREGSWTGLVGVEDIGWVALREAGLDLDRVVSVPHPGPFAADVVATLLEGVDILCVGDIDLSNAQRRRLGARIRRDGSIVLSTLAWPGLSRPYRLARGVERREAI